jgi:hypothetical protein
MSTTPRVSPLSASLLAPGGTSAFGAAFWKLYGEFWSHGALDHRTKEVARIRNARVTNCGL